MSVPALAGSLDFFKAFDGFKGTGSYYLGLHAGYNYMFPSRLLLGVTQAVGDRPLRNVQLTRGGSSTVRREVLGDGQLAGGLQLIGNVRAILPSAQCTRID